MYTRFTARPSSGTLADSRQFDTGSQRGSREGKGRFDLFSPVVTRVLAQVFEHGAKKYAAWNWAKGQPLSVYRDSAERHFNAWQLGHDLDDEEGGSGLPHLAHYVWNAMALLHTWYEIQNGRLPAELDDLPRFPITPIAGSSTATGEASVLEDLDVAGHEAGMQQIRAGKTVTFEELSQRFWGGR